MEPDKVLVQQAGKEGLRQVRPPPTPPAVSPAMSRGQDSSSRPLVCSCGGAWTYCSWWSECSPGMHFASHRAGSAMLKGADRLHCLRLSRGMT